MAVAKMSKLAGDQICSGPGGKGLNFKTNLKKKLQTHGMIYLLAS